MSNKGSSASISSTAGLFKAASGVSAMSIAGQFVLLATIPFLTRIYSPTDFGLFTVYLAIVNIVGAVAALRLERCLYVAENRSRAHLAFKLVLLALVATTLFVIASAKIASGLMHTDRPALIYLAPLGAACAGLAEAMNCWSLRFGRLRDFALGRLLSPLSMAALQVAFGLAWRTGATLIYAHMLSQLALVLFLGARALSMEDLRAIARTPWRAALRLARQEYKFPLFDAPAALIGYAIINLPAIMVGSLFGAKMAGFYGVGARLVTGPTGLVATPLSTVFLAEASRNPRGEHLARAGRALVLISAALIAAPTLIIGLASPTGIVYLLGEPWKTAGQIMAALAVMAAFQAISTPLQEIATMARRQEVRFLVDAIRTVLVFGPLIYGAHLGMSALTVIYLSAAGGAIGFAIRTIVYLIILHNYTRPDPQLRSEPNARATILGG